MENTIMWVIAAFIVGTHAIGVLMSLQFLLRIAKGVEKIAGDDFVVTTTELDY